MTFPPSMATGSTHHSPSSPEMKKDKLKLGGSFSPGNPFLTQQQSHLREQADGEGPESARSLQEAQRISREIDESLQETKRALEKKKKAVRILLLGSPSPLPDHLDSTQALTQPAEMERSIRIRQSWLRPFLAPIFGFLLAGIPLVEFSPEKCVLSILVLRFRFANIW